MVPQEAKVCECRQSCSMVCGWQRMSETFGSTRGWMSGWAEEWTLIGLHSGVREPLATPGLVQIFKI